MLVNESIPLAQIKSLHLCSEARKVVAVRIKHKGAPLAIVTTYIRPKVKDGDIMSWLGQRRLSRSREATLIGGDFNAQLVE